MAFFYFFVFFGEVVLDFFGQVGFYLFVGCFFLGGMDFNSLPCGGFSIKFIFLSLLCWRWNLAICCAWSFSFNMSHFRRV